MKQRRSKAALAAVRASGTAAAVGLVLSLAVVGGCGADGPASARPRIVTLSVFGPWSMEKRMRRVFEKFQLHHPGVNFRLETGTPGRLVQRMEAGERPDVYVSMGPVGVKVLDAMGMVRKGTAREILRQRLILVCSQAARAHVTNVRDLARAEVRGVGMGRARLSAGTFSRAALAKLGVLDAVAAKSKISPLRSYMKGEVDAAIILEECCFDEDLLLGRVVPRKGIHVVGALAESLCPAFPVVAVGMKGRAPPETAGAFIAFLTSREAQDILRRRGPGACPVCDGEKCYFPTKPSIR